MEVIASRTKAFATVAAFLALVAAPTTATRVGPEARARAAKREQAEGRAAVARPHPSAGPPRSAAR